MGVVASQSITIIGGQEHTHGSSAAGTTAVDRVLAVGTGVKDKEVVTKTVDLKWVLTMQCKYIVIN